MKAWRTEVRYFPDSIVLAKTRAKARHQCRIQALEAGYDIGYPQIRVVRAPEYDNNDNLKTGRCISEEFL